MDKNKVTERELAAQVGAKPALFSHVKTEKCKTDNLDLAEVISTITGKAPIFYISEKNKKFALEVRPKMREKPKLSPQIVGNRTI